MTGHVRNEERHSTELMTLKYQKEITFYTTRNKNHFLFSFESIVTIFFFSYLTKKMINFYLK